MVRRQLTLCFLLATGCKPPAIEAVAVKPPPERMVCEAAGERPAVPAEYAIDWTKIEVPGNSAATLLNAHTEVARLIASIRSREGIVTGYILRIEGQLFACSNNAAWLREFFSKLPDPPK